MRDRWEEEKMRSDVKGIGKIHRILGPHPQLAKHGQDNQLNVAVQIAIISGPGLVHLNRY